jgi:hypothetical protein
LAEVASALLLLTAACGGDDVALQPGTTPLAPPSSTQPPPVTGPITAAPDTAAPATEPPITAPPETPPPSSATSAPASPWPTVFSSWTGAGDPSDTCGGYLDFIGVPPVPFLGFGFDLDDPSGPATLRVGLPVELCLGGFDVTRPMRLTIVGDGWTREVEVLPSGSADASVDAVFDPEGPASVGFGVNDGAVAYLVSQRERLTLPDGSYSVTADQEGLSVSRTVNVVSGDLGDPVARILTSDDPFAWQGVTPGRTLTVVLVGFPADSTVPLALYRGSDRFIPLGSPGASAFGDGYEFEFVVELPPARVDGRGWGYYDFVVPDVEPQVGITWDYCLATVPELRAQFCQPGNDAVFDVAE